MIDEISTVYMILNIIKQRFRKIINLTAVKVETPQSLSHTLSRPISLALSPSSYLDQIPWGKITLDLI